ncbi:hypothetical protein AKJ16_DCAP03346 [Drosera capensis]
MLGLEKFLLPSRFSSILGSEVYVIVAELQIRGDMIRIAKGRCKGFVMIGKSHWCMHSCEGYLGHTSSKLDSAPDLAFLECLLL